MLGAVIEIDITIDGDNVDEKVRMVLILLCFKNVIASKSRKKVSRFVADFGITKNVVERSPLKPQVKYGHQRIM